MEINNQQLVVGLVILYFISNQFMGIIWQILNSSIWIILGYIVLSVFMPELTKSIIEIINIPTLTKILNSIPIPKILNFLNSLVSKYLNNHNFKKPISNKKIQQVDSDDIIKSESN
jgi:hypothetical protein